MIKSRPKIIVILGPTASGKTKLAVKLASKFNGEIVSADSRQVYRGMDIGTGKDLEDYRVKIRNSKHEIRNKSKIQISKIKTATIPHHLIDVVSPNINFNVAKWLKLTHRAIADILERGKTPFVVGGTGLYISALVLGYKLPGTKPDAQLRKKLEKQSLEKLLIQLEKLDLAIYKKIDKKNKRRVVRAIEICLSHPEGEQMFAHLPKKNKPNFDFLIIGIAKPRNETIKLIDKRTEKQLKQGMIQETELLHRNGVSWKRLDSFGLEYRWVSKYLRGELTREEMIEKLKISVHQFAKRQMTWFRKVKNIRWVKDYSEAKKLYSRFSRL